MQWAKKQTGFTIVELLIVVVVIAILASITIVSYNGISTRAKESAAQSAISQVLKKVSVHAISNGDTFPDTLAEAGITNGGSVAYQYSANNTSTPKGFCVTATVQGLSYHSAQSYTYTATTTQTLNRPAPTVGACPGHSSGGAEVVTNFVKNPNFENNTTNGWLTRSSGTISIVSNEKRTGNYSMRVVTPGNGLDDGASMNPSATSNPLSGLFASGVGGDHRGSAWVKAPAGSMLRFNVEEYTEIGRAHV